MMKFLYVLLALSSTLVGAEKPNIVLIYADDLGYGDVSCYGATKLKTPHIDKLAAEGRRFTDAHSPSAVCTPSRYGLITGRYPFRIGSNRPVMVKNPLIVNTERTTIADLAKEAGYSTAVIGKWHLGFGNKNPADWNKPLKPGPNELGFDYFYGVPVVNSHPPFVYMENHSVVGYDPEDPFEYGKVAETPKVHEKMGYNFIGGAKKAHALYDDFSVGTTLKNKAQDWIKEQKDKPFFLYLATTNIHHPFTPAKQFQGTSECGLYGDFVHELDWIVGGITKTLEEMGKADNTLIIFTSDNGGMLNETGQKAWKMGHRLNGELLGFKFGVWEGGHRVPFIIKWPGKVKAGTVSNSLVSSIDIYKTMADIFGRELKEDEGEDSVSLMPVLKGEPNSKIRETLVYCPNKRHMTSLRMGDWVYIPGQGGGGWTGKAGSHTFAGANTLPFTGCKNSDIENGKYKADAPKAQLYNLETDLNQSKNVIGQYPEISEKMKKMHLEIIGEKTLNPVRKPRKKKK